MAGTTFAKRLYNRPIRLRPEEFGQSTCGTQERVPQANLELCIDPGIHGYPESPLGFLCHGRRQPAIGNSAQDLFARPTLDLKTVRKGETKGEEILIQHRHADL